MTAANDLAIRHALEGAGVEFIDENGSGPGVRFPRGRAEEEAVLDLAIAHWNKHTLWRMRQSAVLKDPFTSDIVQTGRTSWQGVRKQLRASARSAGFLAERC